MRFAKPRVISITHKGSQTRPRIEHPFIPYTYKKSEMKSLLEHAGKEPEWFNRRSPVIEPATFRMVLLLLCTTGARQAELLALRRSDIQLGRRLIALRNNQYKTSRSIPISDELRDTLKRYMAWRFERSGESLFVRTCGGGITTRDLLRRFKILCRQAGVRRTDGYNLSPRLLDFRNTFAVHRITSWIQEGTDLNTVLPALAAYMGSTSLLAGEHYLSMAPERFRKHLDALSPMQSETHWRDDPKLMELLTQAQR